MATTKSEGSARERLLAAANELFYEEGVHTVGIDRVIEQAGVAKASLYSAFGSKEELVVAYLALRADLRQKRILQHIADYDAPRAKILAVFELLHEIVTEPKFRGCAFANACAEGPRGESKVTEIAIGSRAWTRHLFADLAESAGASNSEQLGRRLALLYDGAVVGAGVDRDPEAATEALALAEMLLDAQTPGATKTARVAKNSAKKAARGGSPHRSKPC
jgi:AcrR family transcriptional regulator